MCRLLGVNAGTRPVLARSWLLDDADALLVESYRNPDGTGLGWFTESGRLRLAKAPEPAFDDGTFAREAREVRSRTFVSHIRAASTGGRSVVNTHPFEMDGRLLAQNGALGDVAVLEDRLGPGMSLVHGQTDSERFLALATLEARAAGGDMAAGLATAAAWVAEHLPVLSLNCVVIADGWLWALRYPDTHSLLVRLDASAGVPAIVVASERLDDGPGWRMLDPGELLVAGPDLAVHSSIVVAGPPRRVLVMHEVDRNPET